MPIKFLDGLERRRSFALSFRKRFTSECEKLLCEIEQHFSGVNICGYCLAGKKVGVKILEKGQKPWAAVTCHYIYIYIYTHLI